MHKRLGLFLFVLCLGKSVFMHAQPLRSNFGAVPRADRTLYFDINDEGQRKPIVWGLDTAWPSEDNIRKGVSYVGKERIDVVRVSFQPTWPLGTDGLHQEQKDMIDFRLKMVDLTGPDTKLVVNSDHPRVDEWYQGHPERWAELMDLTVKRYQDAGREVISIAPFNEPDFGWGQGSISDFYNIAALLRENPRFSDIRICGGNTLNCDNALEWYNYLSSQLDEGNTHQLAGGFDNYAKFFETVRANGHYATADELHNVMEAMVGVEYGMQTGIWWYTTEHARAEFVKASDGERLAYSEHRPNWTAASVYRSPEGDIKGFIGSSERQGVTTSYRFVSKEKDVFFDGHGPMREYVVEIPGGTGYQQGQTNAECVIDITWGDDVPDAIDGQYVLLNKGTKKVMEIEDGMSFMAGSNIRVDYFSPLKGQQKWNVVPVDARVGGDFSYYAITSAMNRLSPDVKDWSLDDGGNIILFNHNGGGNQQWFLEYAGDGWFYISSRHSALCLEVSGNNVQQGIKDGSENQLWRFLDSGIKKVRIQPVKAPEALMAESSSASVRLKWDKTQGATHYQVLRSGQSGSGYEVIARNITDTAYLDNKVDAGKKYYYVVRALDDSQNRSSYSGETGIEVVYAPARVLYYPFDGSLKDSTVNRYDGTAISTPVFADDETRNKVLKMSGNNFVQLPTNCVNYSRLSISTWIYWNGGDDWQRIFDFGCDEGHCMFLTPRSGDRTFRFAIKNGAEEQILEVASTSKLLRKWVHVVVTMGDNEVALYLNGEKVKSSAQINIRPADFMPYINYIGRSQYLADPLFNGMIDDFSVYNYEMDEEEIRKIYESGVTGLEEVADRSLQLDLWPLPARNVLEIRWNKDACIKVYNIKGELVGELVLKEGTGTLDVSKWSEGLYILKAETADKIVTEKFMVCH